MTAPPPGIVEHELGEGSGARLLQWTLDKPERRNAIAPAAFDWIDARARSLSGEVVLLRGAGTQAFCAGFDLTKLRNDTGGAPDRTLIRATESMLDADATFIAVIHGYAIGAGVELAASCDFRVASEQASFRVPAGRLGVVYHARGLARMHGVFGPSLTRRLFLAGETITAREAMEAGALDAVVAVDDLDAHALALAGRIGDLAPLSVAGNRRLLRMLDHHELATSDVTEHERAREQAYASEDHAEARAAMAERRDPSVKGR